MRQRFKNFISIFLCIFLCLFIADNFKIDKDIIKGVVFALIGFFGLGFYLTQRNIENKTESVIAIFKKTFPGILIKEISNYKTGYVTCKLYKGNDIDMENRDDEIKTLTKDIKEVTGFEPFIGNSEDVDKNGQLETWVLIIC